VEAQEQTYTHRFISSKSYCDVQKLSSNMNTNCNTNVLTREVVESPYQRYLKPH